MQKLIWDGQDKIDSHDGGYHRIRSADPYHTARWTRLSKDWRKHHPLCEECKRAGKVTAAECVDHIIPYPVCEDFYDRRNLQSLCQRCNYEKGQRDKPLIEKWKREHNQQQP